MSTWNIVHSKGDLIGICTVCLAMQKGWTVHIARERLDRIDKDGKEGVVDVELIITPNLPFNIAVTHAGGQDVCITHNPIIPYQKQRPALSGKLLVS